MKELLELLNSSTENINFRKENISRKVVTKQELIKSVNTPSHELLNLIEHQIEIILIIPDKGNTFTFVDKKTDRVKGNKQIRKNNF